MPGYLTSKELMIFHQLSQGLSLKQEHKVANEYYFYENWKNPVDMLFDLRVI
jgi:hypothetical protein